MMFYVFDHEKTTLKKINKEEDYLTDGSFTDSVITNKGKIYGFNSYATFDKKWTKNFHNFKISDYTS